MKNIKNCKKKKKKKSIIFFFSFKKFLKIFSKSLFLRHLLTFPLKYFTNESSFLLTSTHAPKLLKWSMLE